MQNLENGVHAKTCTSADEVSLLQAPMAVDWHDRKRALWALVRPPQHSAIESIDEEEWLTDALS